MAESEVAALRQELHNVKSRAVQKIRALQQQVDALEKQLEQQTSPPESASSEDGGDREKFVKIPLPDDNERIAGLEAREAAVQRREQDVSAREQALVAKQADGWQHSLLRGLQEINENMQQVELAIESARAGG